MERKHTHIVDIGLTLLSQASLPLSFWDDAFSTAFYLINRLPSTALNGVCPVTKLFNTIPDYNFLKVFGCRCYPCLRPYNTNKLSFRSSPCLFLGYSNQHKGYKCLASDGRLYISRHVTFDETCFPFTLKSTFLPVVSSDHTSVSQTPLLFPTYLHLF